MQMNSKNMKITVSPAAGAGRKNTNTTVSLNVPNPPRGGKSKKKKKGRKNKRSLFENSRFLYAASLHDPFGIGGARIPDMKVMPTCVARSVYRTTLTAFSYDSTKSIPNLVYGAGFYVNLGNLNPESLFPLNQPATAGVNGPNWTTGLIQNEWPNRAGLLNSANALRVVSAGLAVYPTTSSMNNSGRISLVQWPNLVNRPVNTVTDDTWNNSYPFQKVCAVNANAVCSIGYRPKNGNFEFYAPWTQVGPQTGNQYDTVGGMGFWCSGLTAASTLEVVVVCNWEYIPSNAVTGIAVAQTSYSDARALEVAMNSSQGSSMFESYPADVYSTTQAMFSDSTDSWSFGSMLSQGTTVLDKLAYASERVGQLVNFGFGAKALYSHLTGSRSLGYNNVPQIMYG